jgi:plasmid stabilization system protein ParE
LDRSPGALAVKSSGSIVPTVYRRPLAALDILDIWDHIADDDLAAADRWVDELGAAFGRLATQPMMGRARPELARDLRASRSGATSSTTWRGPTASMSCGCCTAHVTSPASCQTRSSRLRTVSAICHLAPSRRPRG